MLLAQIEGTTILFLAGLVLTCGVLLFRTHRQLGARPKTELSSPATFSQSKPLPTSAHRLDAPRETRQWEVEMHDLARELRGQIDSKIGILEHLIRDARVATDRLEAVLARAASLAAEGPAEGTSEPRITPSRNKTVRLDPGAEGAGALASRRHAEIYSLADEGLTSAAIASRIGSPIGEIELILGLRGKI